MGAQGEESVGGTEASSIGRESILLYRVRVSEEFMLSWGFFLVVMGIFLT